MDRAEAIKRFEKQLTSALVVLDSGFGTRPNESNRLYVERKEMAEIALAALREQEQSKAVQPFDEGASHNREQWISVKERLPDNKEHDWVLAQVVEDNGYMHLPKVMEYRQNKNDWFEETYGWLSAHNGAFAVTHWMPLPEPPKEGADNG